MKFILSQLADASKIFCSILFSHTTQSRQGTSRKPPRSKKIRENSSPVPDDNLRMIGRCNHLRPKATVIHNVSIVLSMGLFHIQERST